MKLPVRYKDYHYTERWKVREEYIKIQKGMCFYCNAPLLGEPATYITNKKINRNLYPNGFFLIIQFIYITIMKPD